MAGHDDKPLESMTEADEEAIRAKLREAGWDKNKILSKSKTAASATSATTSAASAGATANGTGEDPGNGKRKEAGVDKKKSSRDKDKERGGRDREKEKEKDRDGRASRAERRRSRSPRRRDKDRDRERRRDRDRVRERERDRRSRRRRSSRSMSKSRSRSRSRSASTRGSGRREKYRGTRDRSRGERRHPSRSPSISRSRSRSLPTSRGSSKRSRRDSSPKDGKKTDKPENDEHCSPDGGGENGTQGKKEPPTDASKQSDKGTSSDANARVDEETKKDTKKDAAERADRKRSRHRSRSTSRSPSSRSRRRRRRRSPSRSRSASRGRRGRGSSRSRSRSRSRRRRSSRRRGSRSRSRSRSRSYSRRRRSKSRERSHRDPNGSPEPHQLPPAAPAAASPLNPTITQLMQQYPTMSLQDIIAKMQASNVTMAAAVSMKPARELYVGNLPASVTGPQLQEFLGTIIQQVGLNVQPGNPIVSTWISTDGHFAFCEMRSIEECNMALMLNQLPLLGQPLKFGRPKSFMGPPQPMPVLPPRTQTALANLGCTPNTAWFASPASDASSVAAMTASLTSAPPPAATVAPFAAPIPVPITPAVLPVAETSSNKLIMSNIPVVLTEDQVKELVEPFGELKSFELLKDPVTYQSTGSALFEYANGAVTDDAKNGLDGLDLGGIPLSVRRASASEESGPVLRMANMVSIEELKDDEEFADLKEDVEEECKRFGKVVALEIPRPKDGETVAGLGDIFVQFETSNEAAAALKALSGRKFGGKIVKVLYFPLTKLQQKDFA